MTRRSSRRSRACPTGTRRAAPGPIDVGTLKSVAHAAFSAAGVGAWRGRQHARGHEESRCGRGEGCPQDRSAHMWIPLSRGLVGPAEATAWWSAEALGDQVSPHDEGREDAVSPQVSSFRARRWRESRRISSSADSSRVHVSLPNRTGKVESLACCGAAKHHGVRRWGRTRSRRWPSPECPNPRPGAPRRPARARRGRQVPRRRSHRTTGAVARVGT